MYLDVLVEDCRTGVCVCVCVCIGYTLQLVRGVIEIKSLEPHLQGATDS